MHQFKNTEYILKPDVFQYVCLHQTIKFFFLLIIWLPFESSRRDKIKYNKIFAQNSHKIAISKSKRTYIILIA